jgi:hypothetical protein
MTPPKPWTDSAPLIPDEQILEAARPAIEEHDPDALSGQIAPGAKLARSAYRELRAESQARLDLRGTALDLIRALAAAHVSWADSHRNLYRFLVGRGYQRRSQQSTVQRSDLAAEIIATAARYFPRLADDPDAAEATLVGLLGRFDASVLWWLGRPVGTCEQLIDRLTAQAWLSLDHHLGEIGVPVDPAVPLPRAPVGRWLTPRGPGTPGCSIAIATQSDYRHMKDDTQWMRHKRSLRCRIWSGLEVWITPARGWRRFTSGRVGECTRR